MPDLFTRHSADLRRAREEERQRLARDIHDALGSSLAAMKIEAHLIGQSMQRVLGVSADLEIARLGQRMRALQADIDNIILASRELLKDHLPLVLQSRGLSAAISDYIQRFRARSGLSCNFTQAERFCEPEADVSVALYRVLQEALTNIFRHARATQVAITLSVTSEQSVLEIRDNGIGIKDDHCASGRQTDDPAFGIPGMTERMRLVGGRLTISPVMHGGTRLVCVAPTSCQPGGNHDTHVAYPRHAG